MNIMKKIKILSIIFLVLIFTTLKAENVQLLLNKDYVWVLSKYIRNAKKEIIISSFLWCCRPNQSSSFPCKILDEIVDAVKRGVNVTIIFEKDYRGENDCNNLTMYVFKYKLGKKYSNFSIYFDSPIVRSHEKIVLIDGEYCFIGSHNLTQSALKYNNEVSVLIKSKEIYYKLKKYLMNIKNHGEKIF